jgi:hypothetical protein
MIKKNHFLFYSLFIFLLTISCGQKDTVVPVSQEKLLTADASKSWRITASSRDTIKNISPSCKTNSIQKTDNKLIFTKGGAFRYDNGIILEDVSCQVTGCCSDLANLIGNWVIRNDSLVVTVNARIDNGVTTSVKEGKLINSKIKKLEESEMVLSDVDVVTLTRVP